MTISPEKARHAELVKRVVQVGDIITHSRCAGTIEEHVFTGYDGPWMCGKATADTRLLHRAEYGSNPDTANDIFAGNVTHINRIEVAGWEILDAGFLSALRDGLKRQTKPRGRAAK